MDTVVLALLYCPSPETSSQETQKDLLSLYSIQEILRTPTDSPPPMKLLFLGELFFIDIYQKKGKKPSCVYI